VGRRRTCTRPRSPFRHPRRWRAMARSMMHPLLLIRWQFAPAPPAGRHEIRVDGIRVRRCQSPRAGDQRATGPGTGGIRTRDHMLMTKSRAPAS
jgi:hypothetical protein